MASIIEEPARQDCLPGSPRADLAMRQVTAYFQTLGLPARNASEWAERIVQDVSDNRAPRAAEPVDMAGGCHQRAMDRAMSRVDEWLAWMVASAPTPSDDLAAQLKWHLRPVLQRHPESFLQTHDLPDEVHRAVREAARAILPPAIPAVMPAQSLGGLPRLGPRIINKLWRMWRG